MVKELFTTSLPVYVTRKSAGGETMTYSMNAGMALLAMFLIWLNVIVWGLVGLYTAVMVVF